MLIFFILQYYQLSITKTSVQVLSSPCKVTKYIPEGRLDTSMVLFEGVNE